MKKTFLVTSMASLLALGANAQQVTFAPEIGLNIFNQTRKAGNLELNSDSKIGFKAGGVVNIPVVAGFYIQPGIFYSTKGFKSTTDAGILKTETTVNIGYVEIPVNALYRFDLGNAGGLFVSAGPYAALATNGKVKNTITTLGIETKTSDNVKFGSDADETKRFDYGLNAGLGYETPWGVYLRAQYGFGFANLSNNNNATVKNKGFQLSLGFTLD
ncbi:porin family protein [Taibaiella chishuiensis]|uniref:Outer membrane protein with beta-barrel domain n=1 Tax=Taibaiella chishuiensis TaxID=1434707 RepID=A0A2P8D7X1_9BACT|nr:porin family protein [Taibaiella chishuiensis]PSK93324.1 outer membrane protein with beta-barrel domain [Taibaiella chishuiensis]